MKNPAAKVKAATMQSQKLLLKIVCFYLLDAQRHVLRTKCVEINSSIIDILKLSSYYCYELIIIYFFFDFLIINRIASGSM